MAEINIGKMENNHSSLSSSERSERLDDMEFTLRKFFNRLDNSNESFNADAAFDELLRYISSYGRVLYSTISNIIYNHYDSNEKTTDPAGTLLSNLDALVRYTEDSSKIADKKRALTGSLTEQNVDDTRKAVLKIWDHVTLASQQYTMLKQSDDEYKSDLEKKLISNLTFELLAYLAEKERQKIRSRCAEGIEAAKNRGVKFGRPRIKNPDNWSEVYSEWRSGTITAIKAMELTGLKRNSFYRMVREEKERSRSDEPLSIFPEQW